jgi:glycosyltransferase involved in cell wall biosynthesis
MLSTEVLCVSRSVLNQSIKYKLTNNSKLFILNNGSCNGVDALGKFNKKNILVHDRNDLYSKLGLNKNNIIIGFVGRLSQDKGINELIIAWDIVKKKNLNIKLILCGPIDERDPIQNAFLKKIQHDPTIIITGEINDTYLYYSIFNIFILPSYREGLPTVVLEASSMELPIITTRVTGCVDSIVENSTGIFTEINSNSISEKIQFYIDNPYISNAHGKNGRTFILKNYLEEDIWKKLHFFYNS